MSIVVYFYVYKHLFYIVLQAVIKNNKLITTVIAYYCFCYLSIVVIIHIIHIRNTQTNSLTTQVRKDNRIQLLQFII